MIAGGPRNRYTTWPGRATASWTAGPGQISASQVGASLHHAYVLFGGSLIDFASNPVHLRILD